jgi:hypothetical protein
MLHLLVELPNAAGFGRRTLVSANVPEESSGRVTGGRTGHEGADYLAVERPVTQRLANGTVRDDHERLMLVGVDTSRMSVDERERIRTSLRERWPDIQRIIDTLDWAHQDRNHAVEVASLSELLREPAFSFAASADPFCSRDGDAHRGCVPRDGLHRRGVKAVGRRCAK